MPAGVPGAVCVPPLLSLSPTCSPQAPFPPQGWDGGGTTGSGQALGGVQVFAGGVMDGAGWERVQAGHPDGAKQLKMGAEQSGTPQKKGQTRTPLPLPQQDPSPMASPPSLRGSSSFGAGWGRELANSRHCLQPEGAQQHAAPQKLLPPNSPPPPARPPQPPRPGWAVCKGPKIKQKSHISWLNHHFINPKPSVLPH